MIDISNLIFSLQRLIKFVSVVAILSLVSQSAYSQCLSFSYNAKTKKTSARQVSLKNNKCPSGAIAISSIVGATGAQGPQGETGVAGVPGPRGLGNSDTIQSGQTITGIMGETLFNSSTGASMSIIVDFGVKVEPVPTSDHIVVKANAALLSACGGTDSCLNSSDREATLQAQCIGSSEAPSAPPGYVCIYPLAMLDVASNLQGTTLLNSKYGFQVFWLNGSGQKSVFYGTWAYTAP